MTMFAARDELSTGVVQTQAVDTHVAGHAGDPLLAQPLELVVAQLVAQSIEYVIADYLPPDPLLNASAGGAHQQHQLHVGHAAQQPLYESGAQETGRAGDRQPLAGQRIRDLTAVFYQMKWCVVGIIARVLLGIDVPRGVAPPCRTLRVWLRRCALRGTPLPSQTTALFLRHTTRPISPAHSRSQRSVRRCWTRRS